MPYQRNIVSGALATSLSAAITTGVATTFQVAAMPGTWPSPPFTALIDWGLTTQEAVSVTGVSGSGPFTLTCARGIDETAAQAHLINAGVVHGVTEQDFLASLQVYFLDQFAGNDDAKMSAALTAVFAAGGGTIQLGPRSHTFAGQWATTFSSGVCTPLRIRGAGAIACDSALFAGATTCLMSYAGAGAARMDFQHAGSIELEGILFQDSGGSSVPFFQTTNAVPNVHDCAWAGSATGTSCFQDAIVCGGTPGTGSGDTAQYEGYAGEICRNSFTGIRRAVTLHPAANNVNVYGNTVSSTCGSNLYLGACIELAGTSTLPCLANNIYSNCIEVSNYPFAIKGTWAQQNTLGPNGMFDPGASTFGFIYLDANSFENTILDFFSPASLPMVFDPTIQRNSVTSPARPSVLDSHSTLRAGAVTVSTTLGLGALGSDQNGYLGGWQTGLYQTGFPSLSAYVIPSVEVSDGSLISGSNVVTSLTASWTAADIGERISSGGHLPVTALICWAWTPATAFPWQPSLAYAAGQVIRPPAANAHMYQCTTAGTTGASAPTFPTSGGTVTDGTAVWTDIGASSAVQVSGNATATGTAQNVFFGRAGTPQVLTTFARGHILGSGTAPTVAVQAAAGTGATATMTGHDLAMSLTLTTGTSPAAGDQAIITFSQAYAVIPQVSLQPTNAAAAALFAAGMYVVKAIGTLQVWCTGTPPTSTACTFDLITLGN